MSHFMFLLQSFYKSPEILLKRNVDEAVINLIALKAKCPSLAIQDLSTFETGKKIKVRLVESSEILMDSNMYLKYFATL